MNIVFFSDRFIYVHLVFLRVGTAKSPRAARIHFATFWHFSTNSPGVTIWYVGVPFLLQRELQSNAKGCSRKQRTPTDV